MKLQANQKLLFIGDSITDAGRERARNGEGLFNPHGTGYVNLINSLLLASHPQLRIRVLNLGNSGNTVLDLASRWDTDVMAHEPDWLSIMIGINDVWRQFDCPLQSNIHVSIDVYRKTLNELIERSKPTIKNFVLCSPFYIEGLKNDGLRIRMDQYSQVVRETAQQHGAIFVNTQAAFDTFLQNYHSSFLAWDRVHPTTPGHMVIARAWLKAVDYTF